MKYIACRGLVMSGSMFIYSLLGWMCMQTRFVPRLFQNHPVLQAIKNWTMGSTRAKEKSSDSMEIMMVTILEKLALWDQT